MPRLLRRYRLFLIVAAVFTFTLYRLSSEARGPSDLDSLGAARQHTEGLGQNPNGYHAVIPDETSEQHEDMVRGKSKEELMREAYAASEGAEPEPVGNAGVGEIERPEEILPFKTETPKVAESKVEELVRIQTAPAEPEVAVPVVPANGMPDREIWSPPEDPELPPPPSLEALRDMVAGNYTEPVIRWEKQVERFPVKEEDVIQLPTGMPKKQNKIQFDFPPEEASAKAIRQKRQAKVKAEMQHAWAGYRLKAWGHDEVKPVSGGFSDPFCGWAATMVDALDTLWIMGMKKEFEEAVEAVGKLDFTTTQKSQIPVFETTIRYLGGLQGAYDISGGKYKVLLTKAVELGEVLLSIFDTPNRMPVLYYQWDPASASQPKRASSRANFAELASLSLEFTRLAQLTGDVRFYDAVARITKALVEWQKRGTKIKGVFPDTVDAQGCNTTAQIALGREAPVIPEAENANVYHGDSTDPLEEEKVLVEGRADANGSIGKRSPPKKSPARVDRSNNDAYGADCLVPQGLTGQSFGREYFSMGGGQDSSYEYFTKMYLLLGGLDESYKHLYLDTMEAIKKYMLFRPMIPDADRSILFSAKVGTYGEPEKEGDLLPTYEVTHLTCFLGGMVGMGAKVFGIQGDQGIAERLTDGCVWAYEATTSGIMPEDSRAVPCENVSSCPWDEDVWHKWLDPQYSTREQSIVRYEERKAKKAKEKAAEAAAAETKAKLAADSPNGAAQNFDFDDEIMEQIAKQQVHTPATEQVGEANHVHAREDKASVQKRSPPKYRDREDFYRKKPTPTQNEAPVEVDGQVGGPPPLPKLATDDEEEDDYDPNRPLSHKEYVADRIERENIPKGFAGINSRGYILRPEAIESVFYMHRLTGSPQWAEKGWTMFESIIDATRTTFGHSAIDDVTEKQPRKRDSMESFWLAETLKYFYLLYSEDSVVSLDEWVLNTEAHPFRIPRG